MRVLLCDDHRLVAESIALVLEVSGHHVVGVVSDPATAMRVLDADPVDVCVMDLWYEGADGCSAIAEIVACHPGVRVVVLSGHIDDGQIPSIEASGAAAWAVKRAGAAALVQLITSEVEGSVADEAPDRWARDPSARFLTHREREILQCISLGESTATLAGKFDVSRATVRTHVQNILSKLGVHSRLEAVAYATARGLIGADLQHRST